MANKVHSVPVITKSYEAAYPLRKLLRKKDNIWWNSELANLWKEARRAWRKAIKTKQEEDWEAQKLGLAYFKKAVRRSKCDSWHSFIESTVAYAGFSKGMGGRGILRIIKTKKKVFTQIQPVFLPRFTSQISRGGHDSILGAILKYLCITGTPKEGHGTMSPPKYALERAWIVKHQRLGWLRLFEGMKRSEC